MFLTCLGKLLFQKPVKDVFTMAEYPRFTIEIGFNEADKKTEHEVITDDWEQYREWFERK
jgi:hypothetical protein